MRPGISNHRAKAARHYMGGQRLFVGDAFQVSVVRLLQKV